MSPLPAAPTNLSARPLSGEIALTWDGVEAANLRYDVFRAKPGTQQQTKLNAEPLRALSYTDPHVQVGTKYAYMVRALDRRDRQSSLSNVVEATPLPEIKEPVFVVDFTKQPTAKLLDGKSIGGRLQAGATIADGALQLGSTGFATFAHLPEFDLTKSLSVECWLWIDKPSTMPVVISCGSFGSSGWFLQRFCAGWRWHLGGISCDGGSPAVGRWVHLVGTFNGKQARLYQDGKQVGEVECDPNRAPWSGPLVIGQYSGQAPQYQVTGRMKGVKIYRRALKSEEIAIRGQVFNSQ